MTTEKKEEKKDYVVTRKILGGKGRKPGDVLQLTAEVAASPLYRNRVRAADVVRAGKASDSADDEEALKAAEDRKIVTDRLRELNISYHGKNSFDKLVSLLPDGELEKLFPAG